MKASAIHYFFAQEWPAKIWLTAFLVLFPLGTAYMCWSLVAFSAVWTDWLIFFGSLLIAVPLGWFVGILIGWPVLGPLYYDRGPRNGEPFHQGEAVQILTGRYRDRVVRVIDAYDTENCAGAHRVRVELGERVETGQDVFASYQVLRASS